MSSLDILSPKPSVTPDRSPRTAIQDHLEAVGTRFVEAVNERAWDDPVWENNMEPNFKTLTRAVNDISSRDEYIARFKAFAKVNPEAYFEIINMSAEVDEKKGFATVWMLLKAAGQSNSMHGERVNATYFRRRSQSDEWKAYKGEQIPGIAVDF